MWERCRAWDERWAHRLQGPVHRSRGWRWLALALAHSGDGYLWLPALALAAWLAPEPWRARAWQALLVLGVVAVVVTLLKHLVRRPRPQSPWGSLYRKTDPHAFPSGHAARGAALMALAWMWWPGWPALGMTLWALALAWSRLAIGVHYPSDVLAGFLLGVLIAVLVG